MADISTEKKKLGKRQKTAICILAMLLVLSLCMVFISKYAKTLVTEGTVDLTPTPTSLSELPSNGNGIVEYITRLMADTQDNTRVSVDISTSLAVDENAVTANGTDAELNILKFAKNSVLSKLTERYPAHDGTFGDEFTDYPQFVLTAADFESLSMTAGRKNDMGVTEDEGFYYFNLLLPDFAFPIDASSPVGIMFETRETDSIIASLKSDLSQMLTVKSADILCTGFAISGRADKFTDKLDYIDFTRSYAVTATVEFIGDYAAFGVTEVTFPYSVTVKYDYTFASFSFTQDKITLFQRESEMLGINAVIADDAGSDDYVLTFTSSDESVATVDTDGNVKGISVSEKPVVISAEFKYMGNTYTDTCEVYVTVPVSRAIASPSTLSLKVGGTAEITCGVEPEDATIKSVLWFTEDESIAVIDENGCVTAVSAGIVKVYAVTVDGGFRSSCTVTVTEG